MTPSEFGDAWMAWATGDNIPAPLREELASLTTWGNESFSDAVLSEDDLALLTNVGLPREAAPFLSFRSGSGLLATLRLTETGARRLAGLIQLGSDGAGNPICLDGTSGQVVLVDHDADLDIVFMNSSPMQLAESLLAYQTERHGRAAVATLAEIDPAALNEGSFWTAELRNVD